MATAQGTEQEALAVWRRPRGREVVFIVSSAVTCGRSGGPVTLYHGLSQRSSLSSLCLSNNGFTLGSCKIREVILKHVLFQLVIYDMDFMPCISLLEDAVILYKKYLHIPNAEYLLKDV